MRKGYKLQFVLLLATISLVANSCVGQVGAPQIDSGSLSSASIDTLSQESQSNTFVVKYDGKDGKNALELLKENNQVGTKFFKGAGEYVESINDVTPDKTHFFSFYVNGKQAQVGAGQYLTKSTETIEWRLEEIK